jgi:hypothetical protein
MAKKLKRISFLAAAAAAAAAANYIILRPCNHGCQAKKKTPHTGHVL